MAPMPRLHRAIPTTASGIWTSFEKPNSPITRLSKAQWSFVPMASPFGKR